MTGAISPARKPDVCAAIARSKLRAAKASTSGRVIWYWRARFSAVSPMRHVGGRIEQRLPEEILELDLRPGGSRRDAYRRRSGCGSSNSVPTQSASSTRVLGDDSIGRLHQHLDAGAADPLHHMRRHLDRHAGIEPDMARQQ